MRDSHSTDKDKSSILRLSLMALALIAGGLFVMIQDDNQAASPQKASQKAMTAELPFGSTVFAAASGNGR
jgi:hypothetical protein